VEGVLSIRRVVALEQWFMAGMAEHTLWQGIRWRQLVMVVLLIGTTGGPNCPETVLAAAPSGASGAQTVAPQIAFIDERIEAGWKDTGVTPADQATDAEWCRRVYLDCIGRIPTVDELEQHRRDRSRTRMINLIDRLLGQEYVDEFARHWANVWTTVLIGRDTNNQLVSRSGMRKYLTAAFRENIPYDRFVQELLTATGENADREGAENFNGATNFLSGKLADGGIQATAKTAQIFLGIQVQCAQCHHNPLRTSPGAKQNEFWELNSFFRQARGLRRFDGGRRVAWIELIDEDFAGEGGNPAEAEIYYELKNGLVKVAYPVFIDGTEIGRNGLLPGGKLGARAGGVNRRQELARLIQGSPLMPKAIVNRLWSHFLGYGLVNPIDDLADNNLPTDPVLLEGLADRFVEQSYDLKQLIRWLVLSKPYALSSRISSGNAADDPAGGLPPRFARFYPRQMQAEQLYESLLTATQADRAEGAEAARRRDVWLSQFVIAFGTDEGDDTTTFNGTIPQVLMLFNGDLVKTATGLDRESFLNQVATASRKNADKINTLYLAALARRPSPAEVRLANNLLMARRGRAVEALQDIWWALLNSNEFILNH